MKKQQLAVMVLSALSAGILMSCTKPNETPANEASTNEQQETAKTSVSNGATETIGTKEDSTAETKANAVTAIELPASTIQAYLTHVANDKIIPAYQNVATQSNELNKLATQYCGQVGEAGLDTEKVNELREQWLKLATAWARTEMVNFGPAMDNMSNLYINYYPDERGMVHQGVIDLIEANPNLTPAQLVSESAVIQGIPGMEEVLFANDVLDTSQCRYIVSASGALSSRLDDAKSKWESNFAQLLGIEVGMEDGTDDEDSSIDNLGLNRWINSLLSLVETTKSNALDKPLGLTGGKKGHLPADGAGQSKAIFTAKVAVLSDALTDPELVTILAENGQDTLADELSTVLAETSALLAQMPDDIGKAETAEQQALYDKLTKLTQVIKRQLMPLLGVQVGFNSTDGD